MNNSVHHAHDIHDIESVHVKCIVTVNPSFPSFRDTSRCAQQPDHTVTSLPTTPGYTEYSKLHCTYTLLVGSWQNYCSISYTLNKTHSVSVLTHTQGSHVFTCSTMLKCSNKKDNKTHHINSIHICLHIY